MVFVCFNVLVCQRLTCSTSESGWLFKAWLKIPSAEAARIQGALQHGGSSLGRHGRHQIKKCLREMEAGSIRSIVRQGITLEWHPSQKSVKILKLILKYVTSREIERYPGNVYQGQP